MYLWKRPYSERERIKAIINNVKSLKNECEEKIRGLIDDQMDQ